MAVDDVQKTVKTVESLDHQAGDKGGGKAAYAELKKEHDDYAKTHSADDTKKYWDSVSSQLKKDNVLPDLAVAWGAANSGEVTGKKAEDISLPYKYDFSGATPQYNFDKTFANQLSSQVASLDTGGGFLWQKNGQLETGELNKYLENQSQTNQDVANKQNDRNDMAPLFKGDPPLISVLDNAKGGKPDGYVSTGDMNRFMEDYDKFTNGGKLKAPEGSPYTPENAKYVKELLDGKHPSVVAKDVDGTPMGSSADGFNVRDLAQNGGFDAKDIKNPSDYGDVAKGFKALQPADQQAADKTQQQAADATPKTTTKTDANGAEVTSDASGHVTAVKYKDGHTQSYDYDKDGKMTGFTNEAGHKYTSTDGTTFTSTYKPKAGETADANLYNVKVDGDGNFTATKKDGDKMSNIKLTTDNKAVAVDAPAQKQQQAQDQTASTAADGTAQAVLDGTAKAGEGYIKVAARMLGKPNANDTDPDVAALYKELEALNSNKKLHVGEQVVTPEMVAKIKNAAFIAHVKAFKATAQTSTDQSSDDDTLDA